jgi:hypothetical protein
MPNSIGEATAELGGFVALLPEPGELLVSAEDHELVQLDPSATESLAELVQRRLYRRRLGDCMSSSFRGHRLPQV